MISIFVLFFAKVAFAFPQYLSTETNRCTRCHSEQTGYGLLTQQGKDFAVQKWAEKNSPYYQVDLSDWLNLGVKSKQQQNFYQSDYLREATFKDIRTEFRSGVTLNKTQVYFSLGRFIPTRADVTFKDYVYIPSTYIKYQENSYLSFKAGKYFLNYGYDQYQLNTDAMLYSLSGINKGSEKSQVEVVYSQDQYDISLAKIFNQTQFNQVYSENGLLVRVNYIFDSQFSLGANSYRAERTDLVGLFGILNWDKNKNILFQVDQLMNHDLNKKGISVIVRPSYVWSQGHVVMVKFQYINNNIQLSDPKFSEFSAGYNYIPYAQFNILAQYKKTTNSIGAQFIEDIESQSITLDFNFLM